MIRDRIFKSNHLAESLTVVAVSMLLFIPVCLSFEFQTSSETDSARLWEFYLGAGVQALYWVCSFLVFYWIRDKLGLAILITVFFYLFGNPLSIAPKIVPLTEGIFGGGFWILIISVGFKLLESLRTRPAENDVAGEDETSSAGLILLNLNK